MKEKQIVKMFESIPKFETYSQCNSNLEKIFKGNSLKNLIETLKRQREKTDISLMDEISKTNINEPIDIYVNEESELQKIHDEEDKDIFDENSEEKVESPNSKRDKNNHESWKIHKFEIKKKKLAPVLDPFKYHPNYNSIYKNVPSFKMIAPKKNVSLDRVGKYKRKSKDKDNVKEKEKDKILITVSNSILDNNLSPGHSKKRKILNTIGNSNDNHDNKITKIKLPILPGASNIKKIDSINFDNSNHALRFSKYIPRKYIIPEKNKNVSYLDPIDYIKPKNKNKSIDFGKMLHRGKNNLVYTFCLKNPSFGQYNPNYSYIDKNDKVKLFNPEEKDSNSRKKYLMKKLWASYNVGMEYQLVDNNKINN